MTLIHCKEIIYNAAEFFKINVADNILIYQREIENYVRQTLPRTSSTAITQKFKISDYYCQLPCQVRYIDEVRVKGLPLRPVGYMNSKVLDWAVYAIEFNKIRFKVTDEIAEIDYRGLPTDTEGFLFVPDIAELTDMLKFVVLFTYLSGGKTHPAYNLSSAALLVAQKQNMAKQKGNGWSEQDLVSQTKILLDTNPIFKYVDMPNEDKIGDFNDFWQS